MADKIILLVEDNHNDETLILRALRKHNICNEVVVAHDGMEALAYLLGTGDPAGQYALLRPQIVLLDLNLPKVDGIEVLRRLRADERTKLLPVVILTSSNDEEDRLKGYGLGANSYVRKPVDFHQFREAASHLGLYWLLLNEPPPPRRSWLRRHPPPGGYPGVAIRKYHRRLFCRGYGDFCSCAVAIRIWRFGAKKSKKK